jgi:hypothetical protein
MLVIFDDRKNADFALALVFAQSFTGIVEKAFELL